MKTSENKNKQCSVLCPLCKERCGGVSKHLSMHQCSKHCWGTIKQMLIQNNKHIKEWFARTLQ